MLLILLSLYAFFFINMLWFAIWFVLFAKVDKMESKTNNVKMKNLLLGIAEFKINSDGHLEEECIICMDKYEPDSQIIRLPWSELHYFHQSWILKWVESNASCPFCKANVDSEFIKKCCWSTRE